MDPWSAGIGAAGSIIGGLISSAGAREQNQMQRELAENANVAAAERAYAAQQFSEHMSSTAYQRAMKDMEKAGLNPILAYQQGGASSPQGVAAPVQMAQLENEMEALGEGVSSAAQKAKDAQTVDLIREQSKNTQSQTELNKATEALAKANEVKAGQDTVTSAKQADKLAEEAELARQQTKNAVVTQGILGHNVNSASAEATLKARQAQDAVNYGTSTLGTNLGGLERMATRVLEFMKKRTAATSDPPHSAKAASENPGPRSLRDLRPHWFNK